ncbi:MAG: hypothetical protein M3552_11560 [Planctomycetota bacterium]|nr:hypothetical protein [Planctomycetaceae bacterium]MDQ3331272.1 hypothetical protein [Planctomycetota bacterium]
MISKESQAVSADAKRIYEQRLRIRLEDAQFGRYAAIEPISGDYFLGDTFDEAVNAALERHADRLTHTIRIGHPAALHLGVLVQ